MKNIRPLFVFLCIGLIRFTGVSAQTSPANFVHLSSMTQELNAPVRMSVDNMDNVYVTDPFQNNIKKYDSTGSLIGTIVPGIKPSAIAVGDENELFVADGNSGKIFRVTGNNSLKEIYSAEISPVDMEAGPDKLLYIVDALNKRVVVIDYYGNFVRYIGNGVFLAPTGIAYDRKNSRIIVSEHGGTGSGFNLHSEIRIFSLTGDLLYTFGGYGNADGKFYRTQGMTVGRCGNIYVTDPFQGNVSVFTANGVYITKFGIFGSLPGQLNVPMDVVFNSKDRVMVSTVNNGALEVYGITDNLPSANILTKSAHICPGESAKILISFTGTPPWNFTYVNNGANPVTITGNYANPDTLTVTQPGIYTISSLNNSTAAGTCFTGAATVTVNPLPTATITTGNAAICQGDTAAISVSLTGSAPWSLTYTVDNANPTTITEISKSPYIIHATTAGTYNITALSGDKCTGTSFSGSSTVTVRPLPLIAASGNSPLCTGSSLDLNASGGISFNWSGPNGFSSTDQSPSIPNLTSANAGIYTVRVGDYDGCISSATVSVAVGQSVPVSLAITASETVICPNNNILFTAVPQNPGLTPSYQWMVNGINSGNDNYVFSYAPQDGDVVTCTMTSGLQCGMNNPSTSNAIAVNVANLLNSDFSADNLTPPDNTPVQLTDLTVGGPTSWTWSFDRPTVTFINGTSETSQNPEVVFTEGGFYTITLTTGNSTCTDQEIKTAYMWVGTTGSNDHTLNLTFFLEGLYDGSHGMRQARDENGPHFGAGIADKISVEFHKATDFQTIEYVAQNIDLHTNGTATVTIPGAFSGPYYISIVHRNSVRTTSAAPISFSTGTTTYNFSGNVATAFGNNMIQLIDNVYALYGGDATQDGLVDGSDMSVIDNDASTFAAGYLVDDINGDGMIDGSDLSITDNNSMLFIGDLHP